MFIAMTIKQLFPLHKRQAPSTHKMIIFCSSNLVHAARRDPIFQDFHFWDHFLRLIPDYFFGKGAVSLYASRDLWYSSLLSTSPMHNYENYIVLFVWWRKTAMHIRHTRSDGKLHDIVLSFAPNFHFHCVCTLFDAPGWLNEAAFKKRWGWMRISKETIFVFSVQH